MINRMPYAVCRSPFAVCLFPFVVRRLSGFPYKPFRISLQPGLFV
jgi:hypothetical protein